MVSEYHTRNDRGIDQPAKGADSAGDDGVCDGLTIAELAHKAGVTVRAVRFYQSKGLLARRRDDGARVFRQDDRQSLALILQGKRLGFTLSEIREMLAARPDQPTKTLQISRRKCVDQINMLERQRRDVDQAIAELRRIYTEMLVDSDSAPAARASRTR